MPSYAEEKLDHIAKLWDAGKLSRNALWNRLKRLDKSICSSCRKPKDTGKSLCTKCNKEHKKRIYAKRKARRKKGLCTFCDTPADGYSLCGACNERLLNLQITQRACHG